MMLKPLHLAVFLALTLAPAVSHADIVNAAVTWGLPTNITADTDVSTNGSLVFAYNFGPGGTTSTTLNGVTFSPYVVADFSISESTANFSATDTDPSAHFFGYDTSYSFGPFTHLSSAYQGLLSGAMTTNLPPSLDLVLLGLTPNQSYLVQFWASYSGFTFFDITESIQAVDQPDSVSLRINENGVQGGLGQWVTGTFTPNSSTEEFLFTGSHLPLISGLQVRAVPEPAVSALLAAGVAGLAVLRRRKKSVKSAAC